MTDSLYQDSIVAFIDILGWKELLRRSGDPAYLHHALQAVGLLETLATSSVERRKDFKKRGWHRATNTRFSHFSDTVVLSCPADPVESSWMISEAQGLCASLLRFGHYVRGAVVRGPLYHEDSILLGPALVDAYEIERAVANYPRVVVTPEATPFVGGVSDPSFIGPQHGAAQWSLDPDGLAFLEIFPARTDRRRHDRDQREARRARDRVQGDLIVESNLEPSLSRRSKLGWILRYLDGVIGAETATDPPIAP